MPALPDEISPASAAELSRILSDNARTEKRPVMPVGGRTSIGFGNPVQGDPRRIATSSLMQIIDYPARDLTITAQAGIRMADLQRTLAAEGQRLPIDVPDAGRATLGGALATNASGPGRYGHGTLRDYVIGLSAVEGAGRLFSAGGRVVKNVAGYDLCKLMIGSLGTLAIITEVTIKLRPLPETREAVCLAFPSLAATETALEILTSSASRPVAIELFNQKAAEGLRSDVAALASPGSPVLCLFFEGTSAQCQWQIAAVQRELEQASPVAAVPVSDSAAQLLWSELVEFQAAGDDPATFTASLPPGRTLSFVADATAMDVAIQAHAGNGVVIGHLPDRCATPAAVNEIVRPLRSLAEGSGGSLVLWSCDDGWKSECSVFGSVRASSRWMQGVKAALDPQGLLSPGRFPW